jgi:hypothetical protein
VRGVLSSPRKRRRLAWYGGGGLAAAAVVAGAFVIGDTGSHHDIKPNGNFPAVVIKEPKTVRATSAEKASAYEVAVQFLNTAVRRKHVELSYDLVTPNLRAGMTRKAWNTGAIPVMPFPVDSPRLSRWQVDFQHEDALGLIFLLLPEQQRRDYQPTSFFLDLKATGHGKNRRWLVDYFAPAAVSPQPANASARSDFNVNPAANGTQSEGPGRLDAMWLILPLTILALIILVPGTFAVRGWLIGRRATREYRRALDV